jgi:hypothetical protein
MLVSDKPRQVYESGGLCHYNPCKIPKVCCILVTLSQMVCCTGSPGGSGGTCALCPVDMFCSNGVATHCHANSESPEGSDTRLDCLCKSGWFTDTPGGECVRFYTTPPTTTGPTTTSPNASTMVVFSFVVTLNMTSTEFNRVVREEYLALVATAFSTTYSSVSILLLTEPRLRRVVAMPTVVQTNVIIPINMTGATIIDMTLSTLNMMLAVSGIIHLATNNLAIPAVSSNTSTTVVSSNTSTTVVSSNTSTTVVSSNITAVVVPVVQMVDLTGTSDVFVDTEASMMVIIIGIPIFFAAICIYPMWVYTHGNRRNKMTFSSIFRRVFSIRKMTGLVQHANFNNLETEVQVSVDVCNSQTQRTYNNIRTDANVPQITCDIFNSNLQETYTHPANPTNMLMDSNTDLTGQLHGIAHTRHNISRTDMSIQGTVDVSNTVTHVMHYVTGTPPQESVEARLPQISSDLFNSNLQETYVHPAVNKNALMNIPSLTNQQHPPKAPSICTITRHAPHM